MTYSELKKMINGTDCSECFGTGKYHDYTPVREGDRFSSQGGFRSDLSDTQVGMCFGCEGTGFNVHISQIECELNDLLL